MAADTRLEQVASKDAKGLGNDSFPDTTVFGFPDDDLEEEEESVEALLAQFRKEDAEPGASIAAALEQTGRIEKELSSAKVLQAIRAEWTAKTEARACLELRARRRRLRCELEKLQTDELRAEISELRERLSEQVQLVASLHKELDSASQSINGALVSGPSARLHAKIGRKTETEEAACQDSERADSTGTVVESRASSESVEKSIERNGSNTGNLLADIRRTLLTAAGSVAAEMLERALRRLGAEQYGRRCHFLEELLQNADDCRFPEAMRPRMHVHALWGKGTLQSLTLLHNEEGLTEKDVRALCDVGHSTKVSEALKQTGHKGVGFKSTFLVTDRPVLFSRAGLFSFAFDRNSEHGYLGIVLPVDVEPSQARSLVPSWVPASALDEGTMLHLPLLSDITHLELQPALQPSPHILLFLRRLRELHICCGEENSSVPTLEWQLLRRDDDHSINDKGTLFKRTIERRVIKSAQEDDFQCFSWVIYKHEFQDQFGYYKHLEIAFAQSTCETGNGTSALTDYSGPDVFCMLPVQRAGLPFFINAEDLELTTSRSEVCEDAHLNLRIRDEILLGVLAALDAHEEIREPLIHALRPRLSNGKADSGGASVNHAGFFEPLLQSLVTCLRQIPCLLSESGEWCCPKDLRLRPQDCPMDLLGNSSLRRCYSKQFAAKSSGKEEEFGHLGVSALAAAELIELIRDVLENEKHQSAEWMQRLYVFLLQRQHEFAESGTLPMLRELKGLVRVKELGHEDIRLETLARQQASTQVFLGVSADACWPSPELQMQELSESGMIKCVCPEDFAQPEARRFLELQGLKEASLEDIADEFAHVHWRGEFASPRQCWAGLRYLCRIWPRLQKMQSSSSELKSALCCPCEDGSLRPMSEVHVRGFLGEACSDCTEPSSEVCGQLPPQLDSENVIAGLEVSNKFQCRELQCRAIASEEETTWLGVRGTCGVLSGCWRYDVRIDKLPRAPCSIAIGWGTVDVPLRSGAPGECAAARTILTGDSGWIARAKEIKWDASRSFGENFNVACFLDASAYNVRFCAFDNSETSWASEWLPIPRSIRGAELWPLIRLRHGAAVRVSFTGPLLQPKSAICLDDLQYKALAQACSRARTSTSRRSDSSLVGSPVEQDLAKNDDVRHPPGLQWEAFLLGLGASPHWKGCTHRHRWVAAMEKPLEGDCPLCLMPLSSPVINPSTNGEETGAVGLPCEHKFHSACVRDLAMHDCQHNNRHRCPVCRSPFRPEEQVRLSGSLSRRASRLCAPLREILAPDADASLHDMLRVYAFSDSVGVLRRVSAQTSCGVRTLEECFLLGPALRPLLLRIGPRLLPYLDGIAPGLEDALAACGVTLHLDAAGALQVLRYLAESGAVSSELATFLYRAIGEEILQSVEVVITDIQEDECPKTLLALASENLILAQKSKDTPMSERATASDRIDLEFVNAKQCLWDGSSLLAAALGLSGPLQSLYGNEQVLRDLFAMLDIRKTDVSLCLEAMSKLASLSKTRGFHRWSEMEPTLAAIYRQLEEIVSADFEVAKKAITCKEWPLLCVSGSLWNFIQIGSCSGSPHLAAPRVYVNDDSRLHALFSSKAWFLPPDESAVAPRTPLLELFQSIPFGVCSPKSLVKTDTSLYDELGPQDEYTNAAMKALELCQGSLSVDRANFKGVHGCLKASRCYGLSTTLASREADVWRSEGCRYHVQKSGEQIVIVLAQYVSETDTSRGGLSLSSPDCRTPKQLREALACALVQVFAPTCSSSRTIIESELCSLMPEPPPLLKQNSRRGDTPAAQQAGNNADTRSKPQKMLGLPEEARSFQAAQSQASSKVAPRGSPERSQAIEDAISQGIEQIEAGLRIIREAVQQSSPPSAEENRFQASQGLLWNPALVLQGHSSHHHDMLSMSEHRERLTPLLAEMHSLLSPVNSHSFS